MKLIRRLFLTAVTLGVLAGAGFWFLTMPDRLDPQTVAALSAGDAARGERMFWAGGCSSCHAKAKSEGAAKLELAGGVELTTPFGTFVAPNISSSQEHGIGAWSAEDFGNAMLKGVAPNGSHLYPAFPYSSYARMKPSDIADLYAFMKTLPAVEQDAPRHSLKFPFTVRRGIGLWKLFYLSSDPVVALAADAPEKVTLGRYLVEGPGHCGECHTPRDFAGGPKKSQWLAGAVAAEGEGIVPNITSGEGGMGDWAESDIVSFLETGFTPDFDSVGGSMFDVQQNMAKLTAEDREAIAAYLKAVPPHPNGYPPRQPAPQN